MLTCYSPCKTVAGVEVLRNPGLTRTGASEYLSPGHVSLRSENSHPAFTLIEMLTVLILLAVVTGIMVVLLRETLNIERGQAKGFDSLLHDNALADQFRGDVAQARAAPAAWQNYHADDHTLILAMVDSGHVVYAWQDGRLVRTDSSKGGSAEHVLPVDNGDVSVHFVREGDSKLLSLRIEPMRKRKVLPGQTLEFTAALAGDWR